MGAPDTTDLEKITANTKITDEVTAPDAEAVKDEAVAEETTIEVEVPAAEPKQE